MTFRKGVRAIQIVGKTSEFASKMYNVTSKCIYPPVSLSYVSSYYH